MRNRYHLTANLDDKQFALEGKSTTHALFYLLHVILQSLDDGHSFARVFFADFSKGFDLVDHNALVLEMQCLACTKLLSAGSLHF